MIPGLRRHRRGRPALAGDADAAAWSWPSRWSVWSAGRSCRPPSAPRAPTAGRPSAGRTATSIRSRGTTSGTRLVAIAYGAVVVFFVGFMGSLTVYLAKWGVAADAGHRHARPTASRLSCSCTLRPRSAGGTLLLEGRRRQRPEGGGQRRPDQPGAPTTTGSAPNRTTRASDTT